MVDVGNKIPLRRQAIAGCVFRAGAGTIDRIFDGDLPKGDALSVARIAGIQSAKLCSQVIPLCHPLPLDTISIGFSRDGDTIVVTARVAATARTGVEMEALLAVSAAALTLYDMAKGIDHDLSIEHIHLIEKIKEPSLAAS